MVIIRIIVTGRIKAPNLPQGSQKVYSLIESGSCKIFWLGEVIFKKKNRFYQLYKFLLLLIVCNSPKSDRLIRQR